MKYLGLLKGALFLTFLQFTVPEIPHYIMCGEDKYSFNQSHPSRKNIQVFDLLVVTNGTLYIGEETEHWELSGGQALILRPDCYHYATDTCKKDTHFYWLHFHTNGGWFECSSSTKKIDSAQYKRTPFHQSELFTIELPKHCKLSNPISTYEKLEKLLLLVGQISNTARWQEQTIFQELLLDLHQEQQPKANSAIMQIAEKAVVYLQQNYQNALTYEKLGEELNFHPAYISRCMKQVFGCTPQEYLTRYRIEQSKLFLLNTDIPISQIAEKVGFATISYFTKTFSKTLNISPLKYRNQYR